MRERYSFRFTHDEITMMNQVLERHGSRPLQNVMEDLALSFSNIRREQGMACVRVESIQSWFKRHRGGYFKPNMGRPRAKSAKSAMHTLATQPSSFANEKNVAEDETSNRSISDQESSDDEMSESMDSEEGGNEPNIQYQDGLNSVDCIDVSLQHTVFPQGNITEADGVIARQMENKRVQSDASPKSTLNKCNGSSTLSIIREAKSTLEKLKGLSLVEFRNYKEQIKLAVKVLLEEGEDLLSETEKAELPLLPEKLHKIAQENEQVRKELADCRAFLEKVEECEEITLKLLQKAIILEEKYNAFPLNILTLPNKRDELESSALHAKADAEKMKCDKEEVAAQLLRTAQCLQSASTHHKILKAEEAAVIQKRNKLKESLRANTEEWVRVTGLKTYMFDVGSYMKNLEMREFLRQIMAWGDIYCTANQIKM